ncbi:MAG: Na+/H+ antiporter NhaA [Pseudomonadales bacterium]|nr:Na+/H+ antiporter NhaA [Pseudomonadales bacterium]
MADTNAYARSRFSAFIHSESGGGILLFLAAVLAIVIANSPLDVYYELFLSVLVEVKIGEVVISKPLLLWINDGLMAIFFFLVGLELKRELLVGELSNRANIVLPAVGAVGGMLVPAGIYLLLNADDAAASPGWAIPAATDIAFALGVLALLGNRVPPSLKVFLVSLAIFDDVGAIIIIALFYTANISLMPLIVAGCCAFFLFLMNRSGVISKSPYLLMGLLMWGAMLKSGVHATLAGVLLAFFIPLRAKYSAGQSPLKELEKDLHNVVAMYILPLFAFANAGIDLRSMSLGHVFHDVPLGIALGLFFGKQIGIFGLCALFIKSGLTQMPRGFNWMALYGASALCGIGFTMSLFIGSLAFEETGVNVMFDERLGIILGSLASGILGYCLLRKALPEVAATGSAAKA